MKATRRKWRGKSIAIFFSLTSFLAFSWPLLSIPSERGGVFLISYIFLLWLVVIAGLYLYCCNEADDLTQDQRDGGYS